MTAPLPRCWICGGPATSGEHKAKRSDLRDVFGDVTQANPVYYRDDAGNNRPIGSLDNKHTKFPDKICATCNNARTQSHDLAWETLSGVLQEQVAVPGGSVRPHKIFPANPANEMLNVHLYFVKQFGCLIQEGNAPIDLAPFATAIMNNTAHPGVWLKFCVGPTIPGNVMVARSKLGITVPKGGGSAVHAHWTYNVDGAAVQITYTVSSMKSGCGWWHPSQGANRLRISDM